MYRVCLIDGYVDVTEDHSLLRSNGVEIKPGEVQKDVELMTSPFPEETSVLLDWTYEMGYDVGASILSVGTGCTPSNVERVFPPKS